MGWGRAGLGSGGALGVAGGFFLLGAGLVLVLMVLDVGLSRDLAQLRDQQERLWESVPGLWQRREELERRMEQQEKDGWQQLVTRRRLERDVLSQQLEGQRLRSEEAAQEQKLQEQLQRLQEGPGGGAVPGTPHP